MALTDIYHVSGGLAGRNAIMFIGGATSNDYVQVDAHAVARVAANDTKGTYTAWVNIPDIESTYTVLCAGDNNVVEFLDLSVQIGQLFLRITDGTVIQLISSVDTARLKPHRWYHIGVVQSANGLGPKFYINGKPVASTAGVATDLNSWFAELDGIDTFRIGASNKAGDASVTNELKGAISDVKYWSTDLTDEEIEKDFRNIAVQAASLQLNIDFVDDLVDAGLGADDGTIVGDALLSNNYSEFTSRLRNKTGTPVEGDNINFTIDSLNNVGHAIVIQAA